MENARPQVIRWLLPDDMSECAALEELCFPSFWTEEQFRETWQQTWFAGYGLFEEGRLTAYISLSVLAGELEVLNMAVHPEARGRGLSRPLMAFALADTLEFAVDLGLTHNDVFSAAFFLEPLADLVTGGAGAGDLHPIAAGALGRRGREYLNDLAV